MRCFCIALAGVAASAGPALAQLFPARFGLQVSPVLRTYEPNGDGTLTATDAVGPLTIDTRTAHGGGAHTVRLELRYRVSVLGSTTGSYTANASTYSSAGLASATVDVGFSRPLNGVVIQAAPVGVSGTTFTGPGYIDPDPGIDPQNGFGLYSEWRAGVLGEGPALSGANGVFDGATSVRGVAPFAQTPPNQRSGTTASSAARLWSFYALNLIIPADYHTGLWSGSQEISFDVRQAAVGSAQVPWTFFPRIGAVNQAGPVQGLGGFAVGPPVTLKILGVVPAPAPAAALVATAGVTGLRRRRRAPHSD